MKALRATGKQREDVPEHRCGGAGGPILRIGEVPREQQRPSINADVWLADGSSNALYTAESLICGACWMAYLAPIDTWCRSLGDPARFLAALAPAIAKFPVPGGSLATSTVVYNQLYGGNSYTESVGFWHERGDDCTKALREYALAHALAIDLEPGPLGKQDQILVSATLMRRV